jgi:DNA repair protein RecO (recombination protein O)
MLRWHGQGIVCAVLPHGEAGAIARVLTAEQGLLAGYVRGGASRRLRPVLTPGNTIRLDWSARVEAHLGTLTVELDRARTGLLLGDGLRARALAWVTALSATALPERLPYPALATALEAVLDVMDLSETATDWAAALVRYELLLLAQLGFGLDLASCAATGSVNELAYVSPKSAQAVSRVAGAPYHDRLLPLPAFLLPGSNAAPNWTMIADGFRLSGHFLERSVLMDRSSRILDARLRLVAALPTDDPSAPGATD